MATNDVPSLPTDAPRATRQCPTSWDRSRLRPGTTVFELVGRPSPGGVMWAWARSDLDVATVVDARRELSALFDLPGDPGTLLVYLGPERFVDLRGLRLLVATAARARSRGGALAVVAPPRCLRRMVQLGRLETELSLVATARRAVWWARTRDVRVR